MSQSVVVRLKSAFAPGFALLYSLSIAIDIKRKNSHGLVCTAAYHLSVYKFALNQTCRSSSIVEIVTVFMNSIGGYL